MATKILVTGSSGTLGSELLKEFATSGRSVRAAYRTRRPAAAGVEPVEIDLASGKGLDAAMGGVDALFLLCGEMEDQAAAEIRAVEAAKRAGVKRLVKLSVLAAAAEGYAFARIHRRVERAIEASGIPYTFLRPGSFLQNFVNYYGETIRAQSAFYLPCGDAREAFVDVRDIARVAAHVLAQSGHEHEGKAYDLLGTEPLAYAEAAAKLSAATGRTIRYVNVSEEEFSSAMSAMGLPPSYVERLLDLYRYIRSGHLPVASTAIRDVTGREPISFERFARDYAAAWKPS
jgi:uncharacterized protein YbjT (DUF2867 family)